MKYTVKATYTSILTADIVANDADKAFQKAKEMDLTQFEQVKDSGVLKIQEIELSDANFTEEQVAFMKAYLKGVAVADRDTVKAYLLGKLDDHFDNDYHPDYSNITDALEVWSYAKEFYTK
jgi:hypothetical protein